MKRFQFVIVFASILIFSCTKEELKKPTESEVRFDLNTNASSLGHLQFTNGEIVLSEFKFDGDRFEGDDVYVLREFPNGLVVPLNASVNIPELNLTLPQGQYTKMEVEFEVSSNGGQNNLVIQGIYVNSMSQSIPIRFEFSSSENFSIVQLENSDGGQILMDANEASELVVKFDPIYWFDIVPLNMLENATLTNVQGENTLLVTESINEPIHDLVVDRIDEAIEFEIYQ